MRKLLIIIASLLFSLPAFAKEAAPVAADPVLEARVMKLSEELRCLVCQNQSLADSHAELAQDLKNQVREMLQRGMSEKEVVDFMVQRYGDFVLYRPPVKSSTWLLWGGPFLLLLGGLGFLFFRLKRRQHEIPGMTQVEREAAARLLNNDTKDQA